ncbi:hypothetical protein CK505_17870 [Kocuria sp. WN036]|uniref:helix-turn-helix domain-containing protein n=1 Tax=Kocuria sp. WN036 TaxID=2032628 RepID=UPI000BAB94DA|nr:hypothetical protein CK505_17870 [Kocuria sp. WN036]
MWPCLRPTFTTEALLSHGNARTTVHGSLLFGSRHQAATSKAHIAAAMGISRKCVSHWIARYVNEGEAGLHDRSCRPRTTPTRTSFELEQQVLELHRAQGRGQDWLGSELGLAPRTVGRILGTVPPPAALSAGAEPTHWGTDPGFEDHRGALRAGRPGRAGAHGREKFGRISDGVAGGLMVAGLSASPATAAPRSGSTTCIYWSIATRDWRTRRSCQT